MVKVLPSYKMKISIILLACCGFALAFEVANELNSGALIIQQYTSSEADAVSLVMLQIYDVGIKFQSASKSIQPNDNPELFDAVTETEQKMLYHQMCRQITNLSPYFANRKYDNKISPEQVNQVKGMCGEIGTKAKELFDYIDEINQTGWQQNSGDIIDQKGEAVYLEIQKTFFHIYTLNIRPGEQYFELFSGMKEKMKLFQDRFQKSALGKVITPLLNVFVEIYAEVESIIETVNLLLGNRTEIDTNTEIYAQFIAIKVDELTAFFYMSEVFNYVGVYSVAPDDRTDETKFPKEASINTACALLQSFLSKLKAFGYDIKETFEMQNMTDDNLANMIFIAKKAYKLTSHRFLMDKEVVEIMNAFKYDHDDDERFVRIQNLVVYPVGINRTNQNLTAQEITDYHIIYLGGKKDIQPWTLASMQFIKQWYHFGEEIASIPGYNDAEWLRVVSKKQKFAILAMYWANLISISFDNANSEDTLEKLNGWTTSVGRKAATFVGSVREQLETGGSSDESCEHALGLYTEAREMLYELFSMDQNTKKVGSIIMARVFDKYRGFLMNRSSIDNVLISGGDFSRFVDIVISQIEPEFYKFILCYQQLTTTNGKDSERARSAVSLLLQLEDAFRFASLWDVIGHMDSVYKNEATPKQKERLNKKISPLNMIDTDMTIFKTLVTEIIERLEKGDASGIKEARLEWTKTIYNELNPYSVQFGETILHMLIILRVRPESDMYEEHMQYETNYSLYKTMGSEGA